MTKASECSDNIMMTLMAHMHMMMIILCYSLPTVACWLGQTSSPVDFCPTLPSLDWGREGLRLSNRTWLADAPNLVGLSGRGFQSRAESLLH